MAIYEGVGNNGHYTLAERIFMKIKLQLGLIHRDITEAEYDALPESIKNGDYEFFITDGETDGVILQCEYDKSTQSLIFNYGAVYLEDDETLKIR